MLVQTYFPRRLSPARYDLYLASGWFRGSVMLYKMGMLCMEGDIQSVVNVRLDLRTFEPTKGQRKVVSRGNRKFRTEIRKARLNDQKEALYQQHKGRFKGFIHHSLADYLYSGFITSVFDTHEVAVYEGDELVAVSFFDIGHRAMASLLCVYHPDYARYSLGKYTLLLELMYAAEHNLQWYYPGYVLTPSNSFDYKLELGDFQYYNLNKRWVKLRDEKPKRTLGQRFKSAMSALEDGLRDAGVEHKSWLYPFFTMGFLEYWEVKFLPHPAFIEIPFGRPNQELLIASYDLESETYRLMLGKSAEEYYHLLNMEVSADFFEGSDYFMDLMRVAQLILATAKPEELISTVVRITSAAPR